MDAVLYGLPCEPPVWRTDTKLTSGEWWLLSADRDTPAGGVYLRRYDVSGIFTRTKSSSIEITKRTKTFWAAVREGRGLRFDSRAEALRQAAHWLAVAP